MNSSSQSLSRGLDILTAIDASPVALGVREIGRQLGLSSAIVQRLVNTLLSHGFIEQDTATRRYRIGYQSVLLGASNRNSDDLIRFAQERLRILAEQESLNGYVGAISENRGIYLLSVPSRRIILRVDAGEPLSLHCTALGKLLLAAQPPEHARDLLGQDPLPVMTKHTITDPDRVIAQLDDIRRLGYSQVTEENLPGVISVAAPISNETGAVIAGVSLAYATGTIQIPQEQVVRLTIEVAADISRNLGCPPSLRDHWRGELTLQSTAAD